MQTSELRTLKESVKARLKLEDLIRQSGIELKKDGAKNLVGNCPWHNEATGSFKVNIAEQFVKCFGCGKSGDVFTWLAWQKFHKLEVDGAEFVEVLREACSIAGVTFPEDQRQANLTTMVVKPQKPKTIYPTREKLNESAEWQAREACGKVAATYEYTNPTTRAVELIVFRIETPKGKEFRQAQPHGAGWAWGGLDRTPLYNRGRIAKADRVVIVEGEKCVHCLNDLGIVATTAPGGSNAAEKVELSPLAGKLVTFWPDKDDAGRKYQETILAGLAKLNPRPVVTVVDVDKLPLGAKEDVVDFVARLPFSDQKREAVEMVLADAESTGSIADLDRDLDDAIAGRRIAVPFCWHGLSTATCALIPGAVVVLCGSPGATKSLALLQNILHWQESGINAVALMLEDGAAYHLRRALAQIVGCADVTNDSWCMRNPDALREYRAQAAARLQALDNYIESPDESETLTPKSMLNWLESKADAGARVMAVDPVTMMSKSARPWEDDLNFMIGAKRIVERTKSSLLLITHPRKMPMGKTSAVDSLEALAGGAAYERFAHCILFLRSHRERPVTVGMGTAAANRTLTILKSRNSFGQGQRIAYAFDNASLTLKELGRISNDGGNANDR